MNSKRIRYFDIAKGIAILCIVAGHMGFTASDGSRVVNYAVYLFHVPIFFILAGYFLSTKQTIGKFLRSKSYRLLVPYFFTCGMILVGLIGFHLVTGSTNPPSSFSSFTQFAVACLYGAGAGQDRLPDGVTVIGAIWFLQALLIGLIEVRICLEIKQACPFVIVALFICAILTAPKVILPFNLQSGCVAGLYVYIGYLFRKKLLFSRTFNLPAFIILGIISAVAFIFKLDVYIVEAKMGNVLLSLPSSVAVSGFVILLSQLIDLKADRLAALFSFFGENSIVVLAAHKTLMTFHPETFLAAAGMPTEYNIVRFTNLLLQLVASVGLIYLARKVGFIRRIFY